MQIVKPTGGLTLTHAAATTVTFPVDIDGVLVQNNSAADVFVELDGTPASTGDLRLPTGTTDLSVRQIMTRIPAARGISVWNAAAATDVGANATSGVTIWGLVS